jgi:hypothetical protein
MVPTIGRRLPGRLAAIAVLLALCAPIAGAAAPRTGTYRATTSQCGTSAAAHPCYTFTLKIAKGRCVPFNGHATKAGYCVSFTYKAASSLAFADVTCPDGKTFQTQFNGPALPYLLPRSGILAWHADSGVTEGGKEVIEGVEKFTLKVSAGHVTGTLSDLTQENIGLEAPTCTTGTVTFTAKRL